MVVITEKIFAYAVVTITIIICFIFPTHALWPTLGIPKTKDIPQYFVNYTGYYERFDNANYTIYRSMVYRAGEVDVTTVISGDLPNDVTIVHHHYYVKFRDNNLYIYDSKNRLEYIYLYQKTAKIRLYNRSYIADIYITADKKSSVAIFNTSYGRIVAIFISFTSEGMGYTYLQIAEDELKKLGLSPYNETRFEQWLPDVPWYRNNTIKNENAYLKKYLEVRARIGEFQRIRTKNGVYLISNDGKRFLIDKNILSEIAKYIKSKFIAIEDKIIAAMIFVHQKDVIYIPINKSLSYGYNIDLEQDAVMILKKGYGLCGQMSAVLAHLLHHLGFLEIYTYNIPEVHTFVLVDYGTGRIPLDPYYGIFYLKTSNKLATLDDILSNLSITRSKYYNYTFLFTQKMKIDKITFYKLPVILIETVLIFAVFIGFIATTLFFLGLNVKYKLKLGWMYVSIALVTSMGYSSVLLYLYNIEFLLYALLYIGTLITAACLPIILCLILILYLNLKLS